MRKADLIEAILDAANGTGGADGDRGVDGHGDVQGRRGAGRPRRSNGDDAPKPRRAVRSGAGVASSTPTRSPRSPPRRRRSAPTPTTRRHRSPRPRRAVRRRRCERRAERRCRTTRCRRRTPHRRARRRRDGTHRPRGRAPVVRRRQPPRPPPPPRPRRPGRSRRGEPRQQRVPGRPDRGEGLLDLRDEGYGFLRDERLPARATRTSTCRRRRCGGSRCARATS